MSFNNKVVLVTGGSSGIGAATAIEFAAQGAKVAIVGRNQAKLAEVAKKCNNPLVIIADFEKEDDVKKVVAETVMHFGKLDVLVNNAGTASLGNITDEDAMEVYNKVMTTNLHSVVLLTHLAVPHLTATKGNIVNISSTASMVYANEFVGFAYGVSKAGLDYFTKSMASELAPAGVRVNSINPGPVRSDIIVKLGVEQKEMDAAWVKLGDRTPLKRISEAKEIADLILFLAGDAGKGITGSVIVHDNGVLVKSVF
ncbi:uncharacterized protein LOC113492076 [Trichoplusia ni]|uniref:Uncharacterized protein LOC113492076 n=1 Tax=Trichoplusia ni TaxID=7111 RepID=A0A7E5VA50_TRINI|nr:uncharacterized protein LOC113492076 [Trichoplusia ni]